ncbi:hypothetical protein [Brasilonema bromeliae]|uniref:hypothetical protein n=1 Tax=Brasilonema bromeliae TaxID=383615 RepID=UPI001B7CEE40|nr:hypothetical protein [Brasilonema bromeliae]
MPCRERAYVRINGAQEDGARSVEDISTHFNWRDGANRAIFYLGDEALVGGGDTEQEDIEAANRAIEAARNAGVVVHTYFGTSKSQGQDKTAAEYVRLAQETGGHGFRNQNAIGGFAEILKTVICSTRNRDTTPQHQNYLCVQRFEGRGNGTVDSCGAIIFRSDRWRGTCRPINADLNG